MLRRAAKREADGEKQNLHSGAGFLHCLKQADAGVACVVFGRLDAGSDAWAFVMRNMPELRACLSRRSQH